MFYFSGGRRQVRTWMVVAVVLFYISMTLCLLGIKYQSITSAPVAKHSINALYESQSRELRSEQNGCNFATIFFKWIFLNEMYYIFYVNFTEVCSDGPISQHWSGNGPLARYVNLQVVHVPGMPGTFSLPPRVSNLDMHHGTCVTHLSWCMLGSLTSGFLWSQWRGKRSRYSQRMRNAQLYVSGKRPMVCQRKPITWIDVDQNLWRHRAILS